MIKGSLTTRGTGRAALERYFAQFHANLPATLPEDQGKWRDEKKYDAPHGFLIVWSDGRWLATFSLNSLAMTITQTIPGVKISEE